MKDINGESVLPGSNDTSDERSENGINTYDFSEPSSNKYKDEHEGLKTRARIGRGRSAAESCQTEGRLTHPANSVNLSMNCFICGAVTSWFLKKTTPRWETVVRPN